MICASWLKQKTELRKLFVVPNYHEHGPGTSRGLSAVSRESRPAHLGARVFAAQSHCPGVPDQLMVNYYIQHTPSSPLSLPHRGSYGLSYDDSVTWPVVVRGISYIMWYSTLGFFA